jgi:hypothetical protein
MKRLLIALLVVAFAVPAMAGLNPQVAIFLTSSSTAAPTGVNHKATPAPGAIQNVYVAFDHVAGGMLGAQWKFQTVGGPTFDSVTNLFAGVGGLIIGNDPSVAPGIAMTTGPVAMPNANGAVVLGKVVYTTPEELSRVGGSIKIVAYAAGDGGVVADANNNIDPWCVHSVAYNGMSGNWGWDSELIPDGDCHAISPVQSSTWGSIKALYR